MRGLGNCQLPVFQQWAQPDTPKPAETCLPSHPMACPLRGYPLRSSPGYYKGQLVLHHRGTAQIRLSLIGQYTFQLTRHRGRTVRYRAAPAQIPASGITAPGFSKVLTSAGIRAGEKKASTLCGVWGG